MAKIYGLFGSMTGKLADVVMAVRNGEQVARKYQPVVSNPNTRAQVANRAKLKLMSQLSAVMAPVIAIPREGVVSSRNLFVKANYRTATFNNEVADIELADVKLTRSVVFLPAINATRSQDNINVQLGAGAGDLSRVVYAMFTKETTGELRLYESTVLTTPGTGNTWLWQVGNVQREVVVYGYGMRDNTNAARAIFGNLEVQSAESVAKLIVDRIVTERDVTLTETRATAVALSRDGGDDSEQSASSVKKKN